MARRRFFDVNGFLAENRHGHRETFISLTPSTPVLILHPSCTWSMNSLIHSAYNVSAGK